MCNKIVESAVEPALGYFKKGNEPHPMAMYIVVAPCECGVKHWAKTPNGNRWVEAEKIDTDDDFQIAV